MRINISAVLLYLSFFAAEAQTGIGTSSPDPLAVLELKSTAKGFLPPRLTTIQRNAVVSPAAGLMIYNSTKNCLEWYDGTVWFNGCGIQESSGGTAVVSSFNCALASAGTINKGAAVSGVTQTIEAVIAKTGTYNIWAAANGITFSGSGVFSSPGTQSIVLTASGTPIAEETSAFVLSTTPDCNFSRTTLAEISGPSGGNAVCDGSLPTKIVPVTSSSGKIWMDRNLGASREAVSSDDYEAYGCLYQWGRGNDGHASITWSSAAAGSAVNGTTAVLAAADTPVNALFITNGSSPQDWRSTQNDALWQGAGGTNNPCPSGYRLPTNTELNTEVTAYNITNRAAAYLSPFKLTAAGFRDNSIAGTLYLTGSSGFYWSSTVSAGYAANRNFDSANTNGSTSARTFGLSVRCIKD